MHIAQATLYRYALPLTEPLPLGGTTLREREGLLLHLNDEVGAESWGEIAPLPGFSPETLAEATQAAHAICADLVDQPFPPLSADDAFFDELEERDLPPSVRFGIEQAMLTLSARQTNTILPHTLSEKPQSTLFLNDLLRDLGDLDTFLKRVQHEKCSAAKLKVGRQSVSEDVRLVRSAREALPSSVALRLDANRAWNFADAHAFAEDVAGCDIAYIEEPLRNPASLSTFAGLNLLPVALDESMLGLTPGDLSDHEYASAAVLKPTLLGLHRALRLGRRAEALGITPVVSGAYESGVGTTALVALATAFRANAPAGLTPYRQLRADVIAPPLDLHGPSLDVPAFFGVSRQVKRRLLELLSKE